MKFNKCLFAGNLTRDPETRQTNSGHTVCKFGLAVNSTRNDDPPLFLDVVTWNKTAEFVQNYLRKGDNVLAEGELREETFQRKDGTPGHKLVLNAQTVQACGRAERREGGGGAEREPATVQQQGWEPDSQPAAYAAPEQGRQQGGAAAVMTMDDLPF